MSKSSDYMDLMEEFMRKTEEIKNFLYPHNKKASNDFWKLINDALGKFDKKWSDEF